jgi:hypothetical protein
MILLESLIVRRQASLPSAHTAIHLTYGSEPPSFGYSKTFKRASRQGKASGRPIPPIAAVITSLTWLLVSMSSCLLRPLITWSLTYYLIRGSLVK